ncbi:MAG: S8 family serine peptidase [Phycisphaeraceae bacterium]|nr:S8 family serine peptidase [Phycisphaeraceae bacterium]
MRLRLWVIVLGSFAAIGSGVYWIAPKLSEKSLTDAPVASLTAMGEAGDLAGNGRYLPARKQTTESLEYDTSVESLTAPSEEISDQAQPHPVTPISSDADLSVIDADVVLYGKDQTVPLNIVASNQPASITKAKIFPKPRIAVVPFLVLGKVPAWLRADANQIIAEQFVSAIDTDRYTLIERSQIAKIVEEKHLQLSDLVNSQTVASQIGQLAGVRFLVIGSLTRLEWDYVLTARIVDCQSGGEIHGRGKTTFRSIDQMPRHMDRLVNLLGLRSGDVDMSWQAETFPTPETIANTPPSWDMTHNQLINVTNPNATFSLTLEAAPNQREFVEGDKMAFVVGTTRSCFVTLLSVDPKGNVSLLFPNKWQQGNDDFLEAGTFKQIPPSQAGFHFLASSPHGETLVKAIGTLRPLQLQGMMTKGADQPLFQNLGNIKNLNTKGLLVEAAASEKISVSVWATDVSENAADASGNTFGNTSRGVRMLDALYSQSGWASTQLVVITHQQTPPAHQSEGPAALPEPLQSSNVDANEQVFARWEQLSKSALEPSLVPTQSPVKTILPASRELLVFYKPHVDAAKDGLDVEGGSSLGRMAIKTIHAQDTAKGVDPVSLESHIDQIQASPDVAAVIPNYKFTLYGKTTSMPATYYASVQWALRNDFNAGVDTAWHRVLHRIRSITPPLIAVVDQGCDVNDPRLAPALWINRKEIINNGLDDDRNGQIDDIHGYNFVAKTSSLQCQSNKIHHGSFVSSIIAGQVTGNASDVIGLVPNATILMAVAIGPDGTGDLNAILTAIDYAVRNGAKVINLSLGSPVSRQDMAKLAALPLWDELEKKNVLLVCAAGNMNSDNDQTPIFPASLPRSNVIAVMATDSAGMPARSRNKSGQWITFSNYGRQSVHLGAPGSQILGIPAPGQVTISDGTSFAASMVVATVALVQGLHPQWDHQTVKRAILESTRPLNTLAGRCTTSGLLDVQAALDWKP